MQSEKLFQRVVPNDQSFTENYAGNNVFNEYFLYCFIFFVNLKRYLPLSLLVVQ